MKHAYLIMCHNNIRQLNTLLSLLDYKNNDFFLHVDKKWTSFDLNDLNELKYSNLYIIERMDIQWGGYSQIECELKLLKQAVNTERYNYYHLISGQDLPLKTNKEIDDFFKKNEGKEFIRIQSPVFEFEDRVMYYYPIQKNIRNNIAIKIMIVIIPNSILFIIVFSASFINLWFEVLTFIGSNSFKSFSAILS